MGIVDRVLGWVPHVCFLGILSSLSPAENTRREKASMSSKEQGHPKGSQDNLEWCGHKENAYVMDLSMIDLYLQGSQGLGI